MELEIKLKIPDEDQIKNSAENKKPILKQIRKIWNDNEIEKVKSWSEDLSLEENLIHRIEIYVVNGEKRYYDFLIPEFGETEERRYAPRKSGDAWIHDRMKEEDEDDIDKLLLRRFVNTAEEIQREERQRREESE